MSIALSMLHLTASVLVGQALSCVDKPTDHLAAKGFFPNKLSPNSVDLLKHLYISNHSRCYHCTKI